MAQFPSVAARRSVSKGYGLRHEFPEPVAADIVSGRDAFVKNPPHPDIMWQASMLRRFKFYANQYGTIDDRFGGHLRWRVQPTPVEYCLGPMDDSFIRLCLAYLQPAGNALSLEWWHPGQGFQDANNPGLYWACEVVVGEYTIDDEEDQIYSQTQVGTEWMRDASGGFANCIIGHADQRATFLGTDGRTLVLTNPKTSHRQDGGATMANGTDGLMDCMIDLVLWGHCAGPVTVGSPTGNFLTVQKPGFAKDAWADWLERCAGRILWQMAHVECLLELINLCNVGTGGVGGTAGRGGKSLVGPPVPNTNPALPRSTWSKVAPYVDKALTGAVEALTAAIITAI